MVLHVIAIFYCYMLRFTSREAAVVGVGVPRSRRLYYHHGTRQRGPEAPLAKNGGGGGRASCLPGGAAGGAADFRGRQADAAGVGGGDPAPLRGPPRPRPGLRRGGARPRRRPRGRALHHPHDSSGHARALRVLRCEA
ncbi:hypothetical protein PVAP13_3KG227727 [Panicum virgatum]|uniref:Uncharacterized protein n=1 Tax=Panicum virgatum TaxID=38727 RepID=A0A8T0V5C0_PANVG|nr:hypothetical protein PVAP13_3KG227727 [Panicum virgatum]